MNQPFRFKFKIKWLKEIEKRLKKEGSWKGFFSILLNSAYAIWQWLNNVCMSVYGACDGKDEDWYAISGVSEFKGLGVWFILQTYCGVTSNWVLFRKSRYVCQKLMFKVVYYKNICPSLGNSSLMNTCLFWKAFMTSVGSFFHVVQYSAVRAVVT